MNDYGRRIVLDLGFVATVDSLGQAMRAEGFRALARIDVRDHFGLLRQDHGLGTMATGLPAPD